MNMRGAYVVYRRTRDGRLRWGFRIPAWLPVALMALSVAGAIHLAWRLPEIAGLNDLRNRVHDVRTKREAERVALLSAHERLGELRRIMIPVASLNGKLACVTNLADAGGEMRAVGTAAMVESGDSDEKRLARQLTAMARALVEEIAFQESRQRQLASIMRERALEFAARPSIWPVHGPINSDFGYRYMSRSREFHKGVDIGVPVGSGVAAPADGKVVSVGYESGYGLMVVLEHRHGISTIYAHLKSSEVEPGDEVARGTRIAQSGMSGRTTGSHLHYEVRVNGQPVDPLNYMLD
ncbi:M23 family metallopeptidase [Fundidesulfovibrio terrae]|uniref:M23 family metallopeptidase n=1 Tax=Fundidesulfovibrio terrae TaxID=2922866 RepID=UPI001FAFF5CE|nr:M23 family metallopeptidase [Fundidesulfovibrio terrae]